MISSRLSSHSSRQKPGGMFDHTRDGSGRMLVLVDEDEEERRSGSSTLTSTSSTTQAVTLTREKSDSNWSVTDFVEEYYNHQTSMPDSDKEGLHKTFLEQQFGGLESGSMSHPFQQGNSGPSVTVGHKKPKNKRNPGLVIDPHLNVRSPRPPECLTPVHPSRRHAMYVSTAVWPAGVSESEEDNSDTETDHKETGRSHGTRWREVRKSLKNVLRHGSGDRS